MAQQSSTQPQINFNQTKPGAGRMKSQVGPRRRNNPDWSKGLPVQVQPTICEFERVVGRLGLKPNEYVDSAELRAWAEVNKDARYVPERLLKAWRLSLRGSIDDIG